MSASTEKKLRQAAREAGTDKKTLALQKEAELKAKSKRRWTLGTIGVFLLIAVILLLNSGIIYKTTAYSVGDENYTASEMSYHYANQYFNILNQYGSYASLLGLDTSAGIQGLDEQPCALAEGSWRDYLMAAAKDEVLQLKALGDYARANGISLTEEELAATEAGYDELKEALRLQGFSSVDNYLSANYGEGVNTKLITKANADTTLASKAYNQYADTLLYTDEQIKDEYASYEGGYDMFSYSYYYLSAETTEIEAEDGSTSTVADEASLAEAKAKAQAIVDSYKAQDSEDAEEAFALAVAELDAEAEPISALTAGNSLSIAPEWMMDSSRNAGDVTVFDTDYGCYALLYTGRNNNDYNLAQVRHILVKAVADETGVYTDEAKAEAKAKAEEILKEFKAGDKSEESFAALAEQYSEDAATNTNGGLYDAVAMGQMVEEFDAFCFEGHKAGDTAIVYGESTSYAGYHVMYYVGEGENYADYIARSNLLVTDLNAWLSELCSAYETKEGFGLRLVG